MKPLDTEGLAKEDIVARPEVTGNGGMDDAKQPPKAATTTAIEVELEPTRLEKAASAIMGKAADDLRVIFGGKESSDMPVLITELFTGFLSAVRALSGRPWVSFAIAGLALGSCLLPPFVKHLMTPEGGKEEQQ